MKILLISEDMTLIEKFGAAEVISNNTMVSYSKKTDLLDVISFVFSNHPSLLVLDDDMVKPNSARIITSIKNVIPNISTIFVTSDDSHTLGREISPLGVLYYAIKPVKIEDIKDLIDSLTKSKNLNQVN